MRVFRLSSLSLGLLLAFPFTAVSQEFPVLIAQPAGSSNSGSNNPKGSSAPLVAASENNRSTPGSFDEVVERVIQREHLMLSELRSLRPVVETYIQNLKADGGNAIPIKDQYFLGRLDMSDGPEDVSFVAQPGIARRGLKKLTGIYALHFQPLGFAQMVVLDTDLSKKDYDFVFVRREFLGEVRCLVIDMQPKPEAPPGRFQGRIWVEDRDYNVVRFNGTYSKPTRTSIYLHFDSWRLNMKPGLWLPAYVYSEESNLDTGSGPMQLKAQTRLWGYELKSVKKNEEFTQIVVNSPDTVKDHSGTPSDATPIVAERMWEHQAEDNAVERLEKVGLLAPAGEVDKVLQTVVDNLLLTNSIDLQSDVHCRVLMTAPLESFTIGHTIVLSRGLLDVLPDEASLAVILSHELSHIVLGHHFDSKLAFNDRMFFPDEQSFQRFDFKRRPADEAAADAKALELLKNSPYKDKLASAGLFLEALQQRAAALPNLIRPHLGNGLSAGASVRMSALLSTAPQLDQKRLDQIAALPLGGRIRLDPWSDRIELTKAKPVTLALASEKRPFEITPFFPYLSRVTNSGAEKVALASPPAE
jgi:hypothetical protein